MLFFDRGVLPHQWRSGFCHGKYGRLAEVYRRDSAARSAAFVGNRADIHRNLFDDADAKAFERGHTTRMVGEQADARDVQVRQYLRTDTDLPLDAALVVGQRRLAPFMVEKDGFLISDFFHSKAFGALVQIDDGAAPLFGDHLHRFVDRRMAFARCRAEDVADQTMRVHAHQHRIFRRDARGQLAHDQRDVRFAIYLALVGDHAEIAVARRYHGFADAMHIAFVLHAIADQFRDGQHL